MALSSLCCSCSCHLVCTASMAHQTSLLDFPSKLTTNPAPQPHSLSHAFLRKTIRDAWVPRAPSSNTRAVPATGEWDIEELHLFRLHYVNVRPVDFETYVCPFTTLPAAAASIANMDIGFGDFFLGLHLQLDRECRIFGDNIIAVESFDYSEACVDKLVQHLLDVCNPAHDVLMTVPQRQRFEVFLNTHQFNSIPDGSVISRKTHVSQFTTTTIVIEDKKLGKDFGEYQIPGEMVATALHNYQKMGKVAQTIFAIRMIRSAVTVYRADFSDTYLKGLTVSGVAGEEVTIFRALGAKGDFQMGANLSYPGERRALALSAISSILAFCATLIGEKSANPDKAAQTTLQRVELLQASSVI